MEEMKEEVKLELKEENCLDEVNSEYVNQSSLPENNVKSLVAFIKKEEINDNENDYIVPSSTPEVKSNDTEDNSSSSKMIKAEQIEKNVKLFTLKIEETDEKKVFEDLEIKECIKMDICNEEKVTLTFPKIKPEKYQLRKTDLVPDEGIDSDDHTELISNMDFEDQEFEASPLPLKTRSSVKGLKFICQYCNKQLPTISVLRHHTRIHTGERPHKCIYCDKNFRTKTLLKNHIQIHTGKRYKCTLCNMKFFQSGPLESHMRIHSGERPFQCSHCCKAFTSKPTLIKHLKKTCLSEHFNEKRLITNHKKSCYICTICKKSYRDKKGLSEHIQSVHIKETSFPCKICGKLSWSKSNLRIHEKLHENNYPFQCSECNVSFKQKNSLLTHIQSCHSSEKPFNCKKCNISFKNASNLRLHQETHTKNKEGKYFCDVCNRGFYRLIYLKRHKMTHTGLDKTFICDDCGAKFRSRTDIERHVAIHMGGGEKPFKCDKCSWAFSRRNKLTRHLLKHSNKRPFKCDKCSKEYKDPGSLKIHINAVHLKKTFVCDSCSFSSTNEHSLKRHVRQNICKKEKFQCGVCEKLFSSSRFLANHVKRFHVEVI